MSEKMKMQALTVPQVAGILSCHPETVRVLIRGGGLAAFKLGTGDKAGWRVLSKDLEEYIKSGGKNEGN